MSDRLNVGRHKLDGTSADLLSRLGESAVQDKAAESSFNRWVRAAVLLFVLAFPLGLSLTGKWATKHRHRHLRAVVATLASLAGAGGIVASLKARRENRFDIDDSKLALLRRFLEVAKVDVPKASPVTIEVDFRGYKDGGTVVGKEGRLFSSTKTTRYRHDWLTLAGSFADGNRFRLQVTDRVTRKEKSKRKYTKVRESRRSRVRLLLSVKERWGGESGAAAAAAVLRAGPHNTAQVSARGRVLVADWNTRPTRTLEGRNGTTQTGDGAPVNADDLLASLVWTYDALRRSRPPAV